MSLSEAKNRIVIGKIGAPHGVKGEVRVIPLTDFPDRFNDLAEVMVGEELLKIDSVREHKGVLLIKFKEYDTRETIATLTGKTITVDRADAAPLSDGEYYTFDIIGLSVYDEAGEMLGEVENVLKTGSNDVYVTRANDGREILIPALKSVVKEIDIKNGRMVVNMLQED